MGDILRENTQPHLLALLYFDLWRAPSTPFKDPGHKQNLPGSGMWRSLKKVRVQDRHGQNYHDQQNNHPSHDLGTLQRTTP